MHDKAYVEEKQYSHVDDHMLLGWMYKTTSFHDHGLGDYAWFDKRGDVK